jgi:hypothetical protein
MEAAACMLVIEAALIGGALIAFGRPAAVHAGSSQAPGLVEGESIIEVLVLDDRMLNSGSGFSYLYEVEIWIHVRRKHEAMVADELERFRNEIRADLMTIWRAAEPRQLNDPRLEFVTGRVHELLSGRFGVDSGSGEPIILESFIVTGPAFRIAIE